MEEQADLSLAADQHGKLDRAAGHVGDDGPDGDSAEPHGGHAKPAARERKAEEDIDDVDDDYLRALEYGLPPTGGMGMGIDRIVMLLAGVTSIKEVILFPHLRPEQS